MKSLFTSPLARELVPLVLCALLIVTIVTINKKIEHAPSQEMATIVATKDNGVRVKAYRALIARVGVVEAQELLLKSGLPFTGETHLLNHTSGEYAYEQYGTGSLQYCKNYFLSSCYHGALIALIAAEGLDVLPTALSLCRENTDNTVYGQCSHAVGHGLVAWFGYKNLPQALGYCDILKEKIGPHFPLFNCYDGAFMENVWAVHDGGEPSPDRWVKEDDPTYPCTAPGIQKEWRGGCWSNQPSLLFQRWSGDVERITRTCDSIEDIQERKICHDGLARQIHPLTNGDMNTSLNYCSRTGEKHRLECVISIARADYSVGGRTLPIELCSSLYETESITCFERLLTMMNKQSCPLLPQETLVQKCTNQYPL